MRDPERIDRMVEVLRQAWHRHPDWRLNQLIINTCNVPYEANLGSVYYVEDDTMEKKLKATANAKPPPNPDSDRGE